MTTQWSKYSKAAWVSAYSCLALTAAQPAFAQSWDVEASYTPGAAWSATAPWEARRASGTNCTNDLGVINTVWTASGASLPGVSPSTQVGGHFLPAVFKNTTTGPASPPQMTVYASQVGLHPGADCAVLRFKAPTNGVYKVNGEFFAPSGSIHPQHVNVRVLDKGSQVHAGVVAKPNGINNWSIPSSTFYNLQAGESIDFAVDMGNSYFYGDTVLLSARVTKTGDLSNAFKTNRIEAEGESTCAIENGSSKVHCWGQNGGTQLGISAAAPNKNKATLADNVNAYLAANPSFGQVQDLQRSILTTCAKTTANQTFCWGHNAHKLAGMATGGTTATGNVPTFGLNDITSQLGSYKRPRMDSHNGCLIVNGGADNGKVRCWGINDEGGAHWYQGNLGHQTAGTVWSASELLQPPVPNISDASGVSSGYYGCAINGVQKNVTCWGHKGQSWGPSVMGGGWAAPTMLPGGIPQVQVKTAATSLFAGAEKILVRGPAACALKSGALHCWGLNATYGTLLGAPGPGFGFATSRPGPFSSGVTDFALGDQGICAIRGAGAQVFCQGVNISGMMGRGNTDGKYYTFTPSYAAANVIYDISPVAGVTGATSISAGRHFFCVTTNNSSAKCWGANNVGQLGNGTYINSGSATDVIK